MITFAKRSLIISRACAWIASAALFAVPCAASVSRTIEDPGGKAMRPFYESLERARQGEAVTRIIHYGDSHVAADLLTGALRRSLQSRFGNAGAGFLLAGRPWRFYEPSGVTLRSSSGWIANGLGPKSLAEDGRFGLAGVSFSASGAGQWISLSAVCRSFDIYLLKQPGGGAVDIFLDGARYACAVSLAAKRGEAAYIKVEAGPDMLHSIEIRTATEGIARLFGVAVERDAPGIVYDALGINGAKASRPLYWDWRLLSSNINRRSPDLIIIAYGTNEASDADFDLAQYEQSFLTLLNQFREAAPQASLLVIGPPDRALKVGRNWRSINRLPALIESQRRAAFESGAAFFDLFRAMGGAGSIERWATAAEPLAAADRAHLTGAGYRAVAEWLYQDLLLGLEKHNKHAIQ